MATYVQIQEFIKEKYGISAKTCWIAHIKEELGLKRRNTYNRIDSNKRTHPCPDNKRGLIIDAFKCFGMLK